MKRSLFVGCLILTLALAGIVPVSGDEAICMEAESAGSLAAPFERIAERGTGGVDEARVVEKGASGGSYVEVAQGKGNPPAVTNGCVKFEFETPSGGDYTLWCRVWWEDECGNSFSVSLNEAAPFVFGQDGTFKSWHWVKAPTRLKQMSLQKGKQALTIQNREDGIKIDQVLLTLDPKYVPVGIETVSIPGATSNTPVAKP